MKFYIRLYYSFIRKWLIYNRDWPINLHIRYKVIQSIDSVELHSRVPVPADNYQTPVYT